MSIRGIAESRTRCHREAQRFSFSLFRSLVETAMFQEELERSNRTSRWRRYLRLTVLVTRTDCRLSRATRVEISTGIRISNYRSHLKTSAGRESPFVVSARKRGVECTYVFGRREKYLSCCRVERIAREMTRKGAVALFRASRDTTRARTSVNANTTRTCNYSTYPSS